ncbi:MAG: tetratricopeptide repeat protein [Sandarakinorhabdus sp.]|nr:tetratricopeptide repeat protein [Sandarakinorhabdus sp.]
MPRNSAPTDAAAVTRRGLSVAAFGLAILDASTGQARTKPIEGVRLPANAIPATSGDSYQDGRALLAAGDAPGAIAAFRVALVNAPQSIDALNGIAVAYDRIGRYDVSRSYYDSALAIDPDAALVLNNLGYSLYLQGQFQAAIPLLQKAAASNDNGARAAGQRVLTMIAARMREITIASADTEVEVAALPAPQARIEVSNNGEQRLVLAAPAPPRELAASLGDDAALVMVAKPWMAKDDAVVLARAMAAARTEAAAQTVVAANISVLTPAPARGPTAASAHDSPWPMAPSPAAPSPTVQWQATPRPTQPLPAEPPLTAILANTLVQMPKSARPDGPAVVTLLLDETPGRAAIPTSAPATMPARATATTAAADSTTAWLLAPHRNPVTIDAVLVANEQRPGSGRTVFDSDDAELNSFAARMQGIDQAAAPVSIDEAVARLEALILNLRAA